MWNCNRVGWKSWLKPFNTVPSRYRTTSLFQPAALAGWAPIASGGGSGVAGAAAAAGAGAWAGAAAGAGAGAVVVAGAGTDRDAGTSGAGATGGGAIDSEMDGRAAGA